MLRLVAFLSHVISGEGVEVDPEKMDAVTNWPRPLTPSDIRIFLGLSRYNRRFIHGFSSIAFSFERFVPKEGEILMVGIL